MFVDSVNIKVSAGKGGDGMVAYRREKYVPLGGPAGGTGGRGGSVIFVGESGLTTLLDFRFQKHIKAKSGQNGMSKNCFGKHAEDLYIKVPIGTIVINTDTGGVIGDITVHGQEVVVARGGRGGKGNFELATHKITCPDWAEKGEPGQERNLQLELKVLADVGLVGFPSVGKSTLISVVSAARPKIADYHFTTLQPNLGVVGVKDGRGFVMADLPGLIEGAHLGAGLGIQFLKHIERTRVIVHVVDMSGSENRNPLEDFYKINKELESYNLNLMKRPQIVAANKMDLPHSQENLEEFRKAVGNKYEIVPISAISQDNLEQLLYKIADTLDEIEPNAFEDIRVEEVVEYTFQTPVEPFSIEKGDDGVYNVVGPKIKELFDRTNFDNETSLKRFAIKLRNLGVDEQLRKLGVQVGDTVRVLDFEFEFKD